MLFALRELISTLLSPSTLVVGVLASGAALLFFERTRRSGRLLVTAAAAAFLLLSLGVPFDAIGRWLEGCYPAILAPADNPEHAWVRWIAVLGGGHQADPLLPASAHPVEASLYRVVEGVRLHHDLPGSRLLFSGYGRQDALSSARVAARLAGALGVGEEWIVLQETPRTTALFGRIDALGARVDVLDQKIFRQFTWTIGIQMAVLLAVVAALA